MRHQFHCVRSTARIPTHEKGTIGTPLTEEDVHSCRWLNLAGRQRGFGWWRDFLGSFRGHYHA